MIALLDRIIAQPRAVLTLTAVMTVIGLYFYLTIPRDSSPDISPPVFTISVSQDGISAEDAERLLAKPIESVLYGMEGLKGLSAISTPGRASIVAEFDISTERRHALATLREKITSAKALLPDAAEEPLIEETNLSLLPVMTIALSGELPERTLQQLARSLKDKIETVPNVMRADLSGYQPEVLELIVDPPRLQAYGVREADLVALAKENNRLVVTSNVDTGPGRFSVKTPGPFISENDILSLPVKTSTGGTITLRDIAHLRRSFNDASGYSRVNGRPAIVLQVVKTPGANVVVTNRDVREVVTQFTADWPQTVRVDVLFDQSRLVNEIMGSLESNLITATLLIMLMVVTTLGARSSILVGLSIPLSFLIGFMVLGLLGVTINRMVMFGLILTVGMVVNGAIVLVATADRAMARGFGRGDAYRLAARQSFWPITSLTATTMVVFMPLLFWPGVAGKFMSALPLTAIVMLGASLLVAAIVIPVLGGGSHRWTRRSDPWRQAQTHSPLSRPILAAEPQLFAGRELVLLRRSAASETWQQAQDGPQSAIGRFYLRLLDQALLRPVTVLGLTVAFLVLVLVAVRVTGPGVEFFVDTEPEVAVLQIYARGDLSAREEIELVRRVEAEIRQTDGIRAMLAVSGKTAAQAAAGRDPRGSVRSDLIGQITVEFTDYDERPRGKALLRELRDRTAQVPGVQIEVLKRETGLPAGKPIRLEVSSSSRDTAIAAAGLVRQHLDGDAGFRDVEDSRPLPGIEWVLEVDGEEARRYGADITSIGAAIQLLTNGVLIGKYRPDDAEDEIDIRARFPADDRSIGQIDILTLQTASGPVPIRNFLERKPQRQSGERFRKDRRYMVTIAADLAEGARHGAKTQELTRWLESQPWQADTAFRFRGTGEDQQVASGFLKLAMLTALVLIFAILVAKFDNFYQTAVALSTVVLSMIGVLIGMLVTGQTFSVIMTGTGILVLSGVVVNNALLLIDRSSQYSRLGMPAVIAVKRACAERIRPVMLTSWATVVGLVPAMLEININLFKGGIEFGSVTSGWWVQFATVLVFGLSFATLATLIVVPTMLAAPSVIRNRWRSYEKQRIAGYLEGRRVADRASRLLERQPSGKA